MKLWVKDNTATIRSNAYLSWLKADESTWQQFIVENCEYFNQNPSTFWTLEAQNSSISSKILKLKMQKFNKFEQFFCINQDHLSDRPPQPSYKIFWWFFFNLVCFSLNRELVPQTEMVPSDARQMHVGPHLGPPLPPHANVLPGRAFPGPGEQNFSLKTAEFWVFTSGEPVSQNRLLLFLSWL